MFKEKHGLSRTSEYRCWQQMKDRCYNTRNHAYKNYGARGIKVCDRWLISFDNFIEDMGFKVNKKYSLDRINNDGNYEPSNCRWTTIDIQLTNRRKHDDSTKKIMRYKNIITRYGEETLFNILKDLKTGVSVYSLVKKYKLKHETITKLKKDTDGE